MAFKIYNKNGEYMTTIGIIKNMDLEQEKALIIFLYPEYKECTFKAIKKETMKNGRKDDRKTST